MEAATAARKSQHSYLEGPSRFVTHGPLARGPCVTKRCPLWVWSASRPASRCMQRAAAAVDLSQNSKKNDFSFTHSFVDADASHPSHPASTACPHSGNLPPRFCANTLAPASPYSTTAAVPQTVVDRPS
eukprot:COSAG01_NODE_366_length_18064_cov_35.830615_14_plen_129_part_00